MNSFIKKKLKTFLQSNINKKQVNSLLNYIVSKHKFIFCFHEITNSPSEFQKKYDLYIKPDIFEKQIKSLIKIFSEKKRNLILNQKFLITFDDGYIGSFNEGLKICSDNKLKPIYFLNMHSIKQGNPLLSAQVLYLKEYSEKFNNFCKNYKIKSPEYINISTSRFLELCKNNYIDLERINKFQGELISINNLSKLGKNKNLYLASHFYKHYNSIALNGNEFQTLLKKNYDNLKNYENFINFLAFTNGQPKTCFKPKHIKMLKKLNINFSFSSYGSLFNNEFLFDRLVLDNSDATDESLKLKILIGYLKKINFIRKFYI